MVDLPNAPNAPGDQNGDYGPPAPVAQWVIDHPDVGIGPYVSGNHIYVGLKGDAEPELAQVRQDTAQGANVRAFRATYSQADLSPVIDAIWADRDRLHHEGIEVYSLATDAYTDRVAVSLDSVDDQTCTTFRQRYGDGRFFFYEGGPIIPT